MTLKEFIKKTLIEIGQSEDREKEIEDKIVDEAKKRKTGNCAAISDDDVRKMIIKFASGTTQLQNQTKEPPMSISAQENEKRKKCEEQKKDYQISLW